MKRKTNKPSQPKMSASDEELLKLAIAKAKDSDYYSETHEQARKIAESDEFKKFLDTIIK